MKNKNNQNKLSPNSGKHETKVYPNPGLRHSAFEQPVGVVADVIEWIANKRWIALPAGSIHYPVDKSWLNQLHYMDSDLNSWAHCTFLLKLTCKALINPLTLLINTGEIPLG